MHTTMQTLGRVAIISGTVFVALLNVFMFEGVENIDEAAKLGIYIRIYEIALVIPLVSVAGVILAGFLRRREIRRLLGHGIERAKAEELLHGHVERTPPNWWILGGSLVFVVFTITMGLGEVPYNQEIIFAGSMLIVLFLISRLLKELEPGARNVLLGTAIIIFVYRAMPTPGAGQTWWMIDELGFDQQFLAVLSLISSVLTLFGMFIFRRFMAERSIAYVIVFLTIASTVLYMPIVGMFYGLHQWTASLTGGVVDAQPAEGEGDAGRRDEADVRRRVDGQRPVRLRRRDAVRARHAHAPLRLVVVAAIPVENRQAVVTAGHLGIFIVNRFHFQ